jgi:5-methylcytosine-specific restriction endonuclease McrA
VETVMTIETMNGEVRKVARRGTTNGNDRGGSDTRRRRRAWLVETYRADVDVIVVELFHGPLVVPVVLDTEGAEPACRCYRCGALLTADTVTVDRIKPGCHGGTYRRENIRPACGRCNSSTGATVRRKA